MSRPKILSGILTNNDIHAMGLYNGSKRDAVRSREMAAFAYTSYIENHDELHKMDYRKMGRDVKVWMQFLQNL